MDAVSLVRFYLLFVVVVAASLPSNFTLSTCVRVCVSQRTKFPRKVCVCVYFDQFSIKFTF